MKQISSPWIKQFIISLPWIWYDLNWKLQFDSEESIGSFNWVYTIDGIGWILLSKSQWKHGRCEFVFAAISTVCVCVHCKRFWKKRGWNIINLFECLCQILKRSHVAQFRLLRNEVFYISVPTKRNFLQPKLGGNLGFLGGLRAS
jgi:hypothetical protein